MELKYSIKPDEKTVKAMGRDMNVSYKDMIMIAQAIRNKKLEASIKKLELVSELKDTIPYTRFNGGIGHRRGNVVKCAKYPQKAAKLVLAILKNLQANAEFKGYDSGKVKIIHSQALLGVCRPRRKPKGRYTVWETEHVHFQVVGKEI
jgi:large subunit ribosomal protein L22